MLAYPIFITSLYITNLYITYLYIINLYIIHLWLVYSERVVPVAVYEATWLPSSSSLVEDNVHLYDDHHDDDGDLHNDDHDDGYLDIHHDDGYVDDDNDRSNIINISLVEQSLGKSNHHHIYWLRIGLLVNTRNNGNDGDNSSSNVDANVDGGDAVRSIELIDASERKDDDGNDRKEDDNYKKDDDAYSLSLKDLVTESAEYSKANDNDNEDGNEDDDGDKDHTQLYVLGR